MLLLVVSSQSFGAVHHFNIPKSIRPLTIITSLQYVNFGFLLTRLNSDIDEFGLHICDYCIVGSVSIQKQASNVETQTIEKFIQKERSHRYIYGRITQI